MKKIIMLIILIISLSFVNGCVRDEDKDDNNAGTDIDVEIDLGGKDTDKDDKDIDKPEDDKEIDKAEDTGGPLVDELEEEAKIEYNDEKYGFSIEMPASWEDHYEVEYEEWFDESSESISFNFVYGNIYSNIFNIIVIDEVITEEEWDDPFQIYMTEQNGKTYSYIQAMEPPEELLEEENDIYLNKISKMVRDVAEVMESFKFNK